MKTIIFAILLLFVGRAFANEDGWYCENDSTKREGNTFLACGIGDGGDESRARLNALNNAIQEFTIVCNMDSDCRRRPRSVDVLRTTCKQLKSDYMGFGTNWKCVRAIAITIAD